MFKIGDLVLCNYNYTYCNGPEKGKVYKIISLDRGKEMLGFILPNCTYGSTINTGEYPNWGFNQFELFKSKEIKNDIEWLDAIQQNFKEGV